MALHKEIAQSPVNRAKQSSPHRKKAERTILESEVVR